MMELREHLSPSRPPPPAPVLRSYPHVDDDDDDDEEEVVLEQRYQAMAEEGGEGRHLLWRRGDRDPRYGRTTYAPIWHDVPRKNYNRGNARMGAWALLTLAGWGWTRVVCLTVTLPDDCVKHASVLDTLSDVQLMLTFSFVQGWFTEVTQPRRYQYVFSRWYFFVLYFLSGTIFSGISSIPALESSLSSGSHYTAAQLLVYVVLAVIVVGVILWHFFYCWQVYPPRNFWTYVGARVAVLGFYLIYALVGMQQEGDSLHLHHYFLAWAVSLLAQFQHPVSIALLAITAGIFVQGIGAYHAASLFDQSLSPYWPPPYPTLAPQEGDDS